ncbi:MAG: ABC transporter permease [Candidatus Caldatribacteriota bacterium]
MYWRYCLKRIIYGLITFIILIFIFSALFNTTMEKTLKSQIEEEIRAETLKMDTKMTPEEITHFIAERRTFKMHLYHLDKPIWNRIVWRAINVLSLNFGKATIMKSSAGETDVWEIISECLPRTILLFTTAICINIILGLLLGLKKAQKAGGFMDKLTSIGTMVVYGMPSWWLGMLVIMFFAYQLRLFPSGSLHSIPPPTGLAYYIDLLYHMALPVLTLVVIGFWGSSYLIRNIVLGILQEDYIMATRTRGIPERKVLYGHAMRTAAPPIVTMALLSLLASVGGNIIFEGIFSWPGLGNLYWISIEQNDIPVLMGNLFITTALYMAGLVVLDLVYGFLDPRIKVGGRK